MLIFETRRVLELNSACKNRHMRIPVTTSWRLCMRLISEMVHHVNLYSTPLTYYRGPRAFGRTDTDTVMKGGD